MTHTLLTNWMTIFLILSEKYYHQMKITTIRLTVRLQKLHVHYCSITPLNTNRPKNSLINKYLLSPISLPIRNTSIFNKSSTLKYMKFNQIIVNMIINLITPITM